MKNYLVIFLLFSLFSVAYGQETKSLHLSQDSFRLEQTDALTNVNIDPIRKDPSNRKCARIKLGINRMTPDEIAKVQVKTVGGNVVLTKRVPMTHRGGLEIEMTARTATFYLYHPTLGESNTVTVSLEGDKVYLMDAWAEQSLPMTVFCARGGAEVYVDDVYRGKIDNVDHTLTVTGIMAGMHKIRVQSGNDVTEQEVELTSDKVFFNVELKSTAHLQQFVVFNVTPANALVELDGETLVVNGGVAQKLVKFGTYSYSVVAKNYHKTAGHVTVNSTAAPKEVNVVLSPAFGWVNVSGRSVSGANVYIDNEYIGKAPIKSGNLSSGVHSVKIVKDLHKEYNTDVEVKDGATVELSPALKANFATVRVKTPDATAKIRVNNVVKGTGSWTGQLSPGSYRIEVSKDCHTSVFESIEVKEGDDVSLDLDAPTPISGTLAISTVPSGAHVYIDGVFAGYTPYYKPDALVGSHTVTIAKEGYKDKTVHVSIEEGKNTERFINMETGISAMLEPKKLTSIKRKYDNPDRGYMGTASMNFGYGFVNGYFSGVYQTTQGYQFNSYLFLGAQLGMFLDEEGVLPVTGVDFRWFWSDDKWGTGYMSLKIGYPYIADVTVGYRVDFFGFGVSVGAMGIMGALEFFW